VPTIGTYINIDVRNFFNVNDSQIRKLVDSIIPDKSISDNEKGVKCLTWVIDNIKYKADASAIGQTEYWQYAYETGVYLKSGDCEDMHILLANMMAIAGVPYWKLRLSAGDVDDNIGHKGGHCFVTFFNINKVSWVLLDACFYPNKLPIDQRKNYKDETYYKETWFSWNEKYAFSKSDVRLTSEYVI
jgi:hypothetical protein